MPVAVYVRVLYSANALIDPEDNDTVRAVGAAGCSGMREAFDCAHPHPHPTYANYCMSRIICSILNYVKKNCSMALVARATLCSCLIRSQQEMLAGARWRVQATLCAVRPRRALACMPGGNRARGTQARVTQCTVRPLVLFRGRRRFRTSAKTFSGLCVEMASKMCIFISYFSLSLDSA